MSEESQALSPLDGNGNATINGQFFHPHDPPELTHVVDRYALARARREGKEPPFQFPLNWPPLGWESRDTPLDDSPRAVRQWFDYFVHPAGPLRCSEANETLRNVNWGTVVRDAWRLVRHQNSLGPQQVEIRECEGRYDSRGALLELESLRAKLFPPPPLTETEAAVLQELDASPPPEALSGKEIIQNLRKKRIPIQQSTLTRHIMPKLKKWYGVHNRPGAGYYRVHP